MQQRQRHDVRPVHAEDYRGDPGDLLHDLRRLRVRGGEPEHGGHGDIPGHLRRVGAGGDGPRLLRRPHLRRALQPRRHRRLRHVWALSLEAGAVVRGGPGAGIHAGQPDAARGVRRRHGARALLRNGAVGVGRAGGGARVRHLLLPHVRHLRRRHRQQSDRGTGWARRRRHRPAQRALRRAHYGRIDEPGADLGPSYRRRPVQKRLGVRGWAGVRDGGGRVGLQPGPLHRQAAARDHQERLVPQERAHQRSNHVTVS